MATVQKTVILDFQADFTSIDSAIDTLEKTGVVEADIAAKFRATNKEIQAQVNGMTKLQNEGNKSTQSFTKLQQLLTQYPKTGMQRFLLQVGNELAANGIKAEDFFKKVKKGSDDTVPKFASLKQELKAVKDEMQKAALAGGVLSEEYQKLKQRAGELDDTIKDVSNDIANAGSDTRGIDNFVGTIGALAGGFSAVQGAAALFGNESEDVQKALLKVNAAMAVATGLQQVSNALTKQGSLTRVADMVATYGQIAAQKIYTAVTGKATAATTLFKVALAATGIGLVVVAVVALAAAFKDSVSSVELATQSIEGYNNALQSTNDLIERNLSISLARAEAAGASESQLTRLRGKALQEQIRATIKVNRDLATQRDALDATSKAWFLLNSEIEKNNAVIESLNTEVLVTSINLEKQVADERKKAAEEAAAKAKEQRDKAIAAAAKQRAKEFADFKAGVELQLLAAEEGSKEQIELRKRLLKAQLQIDLDAEGLSINQKKLLIQEFFKARGELDKKYGAGINAGALEDYRNRLSAELEDLNLNEEDKLSAKIAFLEIGAAQEIAAAEGNAAKILAINARLQSAITEAKIESIKKAAADELALSTANGGSARRALEATASNEKLKSGIRINAIRQLQQTELSNIDILIKANRDAIAVKGADEKALSIEYAQLLDQKAAATEQTEQRITDIIEAENQKRRDSDLAYIQASLQGLQEIGNIIGGIQSNQQAATEIAIEQRRKEVADLLEAGAITEKEAERRNKRIEAQERAAKNRAAKQQKDLAIFNAALAVPQAFIAGLTAPFPIGGPIYGAILAGLAAIQLGIVAARPVPKFATGKKGSYSGLGIVGDAGAELIESADGRMHVATKPTMVYLGAKDKVYTAGETKQMMPFVNKQAILSSDKRDAIDYDRLAASLSKVYKPQPGTSINIDKDFISESVANGLMRNHYFDRYYSSK